MKSAALVLALATCLSAQVSQKEIDEAIRRGAEYLKANHQAGGRVMGRGGTDELVALTLAHAGVSPSEEPLRGMIAQIAQRELTGTYNVALQAVLLTLVDPRKHRERIAECGQWLVDSQCSNGQWTYSGALRQKPMRTVVSGNAESGYELRDKQGLESRTAGDNSNAQFGLLGLWAVMVAGVKVPPGPFQRAEGWWKAQQGTDGGWGYGARDLSYGSMTCAGIAAMAICARGLGEPARNAGHEAAGLRWLGNLFTVKGNPKSGAWHYYYLYSLERAGTITGQKRIGDHDWYVEGARFLVDTQAKDGSWTEHDPITDTCFAVLFLKRATLSLVTPSPLDKAVVTPDDPASEPAEPDDASKDGK